MLYILIQLPEKGKKNNRKFSILRINNLINTDIFGIDEQFLLQFKKKNYWRVSLFKYDDFLGADMKVFAVIVQNGLVLLREC
jgi:hypothetical protein